MNVLDLLNIGNIPIGFAIVSFALDPELVGSVLNVMRELKRGGMTMLVVSHEMRFACDAADRVIFMDHGVIGGRAAAADVFGPDEPRTRAFIAEVAR